MTQLDEDLARLIRNDPLHHGVADTAGMIRAGSRLRRRRHLAISTGAGLAAAAVVAPFMLLGGGDDKVSNSPATSTSATSSASATTAPSPTASPTPSSEASFYTVGPDTVPGVCGVAACKPAKGAYGSLEDGELIGTSLEMGTFDGLTEVLYAVRNKGFDTRTGKPLDSVDVISSGVVVEGKLRRTVWGLQPNEDRLGPVGLYGGGLTLSTDGEAHFGVFGYFEGEHDVITATSGGQTREVSGLSTEVYPGYTVFYDTGAWDDAWDVSRADITYGVPGGASCSLLECGMVG